MEGRRMHPAPAVRDKHRGAHWRRPAVWFCISLVAVLAGCLSPAIAPRNDQVHSAGPPATAPAGASMPLRVLTWNIHNAEHDDDPVRLLDQIAEVIAAHKPDLVALQEVDRNAERSGRVDQAARIAERTGMHHAFAPF